MHFTTLLTLLKIPIIVTATLDPATSNTKGYKPKSLNCTGNPPYTPKQTNTTIITPFLKHPKSQQQSKPPNAPTTPASRGPKHSPSSKQTTNTTRPTARRTGPAVRILAARLPMQISKLTRTIGCFIGMGRGLVVG